MGAPVITAAALRSRTGRKILAGPLLILVLVAALLLTPLVAIPFAIAGGAASAVPTGIDAAPAASGAWAVPLAGGYSKGRGFGYHPVQGCGYCSTNHQGYDMAQGCGATIYAAGPGRVITAGSWQGYGNTVRIDHGDQVVTLYGHMQWGSLRVTVGEEVAAGAPLGAEGNTGKSFGCHLHYEVQKSGAPVDPEPFMAGLGLQLK
ncbi:murein DD-endopeptidase MepM/ murein hydrolase activator NlpD [Microbacterium trichothecenolyticum]|uniref:M23 family metallopeptidase n=1 Tax=Microbacterium trichothecenolyticum TaxID=69370 RepID=UPI002865FADE|nr:M23 family metallopeptidase [Microbacterium trichothecenolyticum]MDR7113723.1 murein DD-endopeptidase MepM/ murein hydrolase activator NlpD [Microbacterium trichothecenolyticum]